MTRLLLLSYIYPRWYIDGFGVTEIAIISPCWAVGFWISITGELNICNPVIFSDVAFHDYLSWSMIVCKY